MKLLILTNDLGGLIIFRKELLMELVKTRTVFVSAPNNREKSKIVEQIGCSYIPCRLLDRRGTNPLKDFSLMKYYASLIQRVNPDLVLSYTIKPNSYGGIVCGIQNVPYISNITGLGTSIENGGILAKISTTLYKLGLRRAECVIFQNRANQELFTKRKIVHGKTRIVPGSGVNLEQHVAECYPDETDGIRFLFVGRIMKDKGVRELIKAFRVIHSKYPNTTLDIIGPEEEDFSGVFQSAGDAVHYLGLQSNMQRFYRNCHCVVLPSYHEGTANVMLEASATARPVITTIVPGCRETFDEGITGFGCEAKDANSLIEAIEKFLKLSTEERAQMGLNARAKMEREYDRQLVIDAYLEEIEQIEKRSRQ